MNDIMQKIEEADKKFTEDIVHSMRLWAIENNLEQEFVKEILTNERFDTWVKNNVLVKRFGYFVLEHTVGIYNRR